MPDEIEPAYRTGRHEENLTRWDDYNCDLPTVGRDSLSADRQAPRQIGTSSDRLKQIKNSNLPGRNKKPTLRFDA